MAQGLIKKKSAASSKKQNVLAPKRMGAKVIAPKNKKLIQQQKMAKKLSAGQTGKTERTLAERAGHLELLPGGKKSRNASGSSKSKDGNQKKKSGK